MQLIERYLFKQFLWPTVAAVSALGAVALLSQTLQTLDIIVDQRQSAWVFLKIVALSMPAMLAIVLPIGIFVAALLSLNRLHTEQEIVVCFAGGLSRWRVIAPGVKLACIAALIILFVNLWVQPWCARAMREELFRVRTDLAGSLVREGQFTQPAPNLTVYAQSSDAEGVLHNVFLHQNRGDGESSTFASKRGVIGKQGNKPVFVLMDGSQQQFSDKQVLNFLAFQEYVFDLSPYVNTAEDVHFKSSDRYMHELVFPDKRQPWERTHRKELLGEANYRVASPLYSLAFMALALNAVIGGAFSRIGYGRRILAAAAAALVVRILGFGAQAVCQHGAPVLNILQYVVPLAPTWWAMRRLFGETGSPLRLISRDPTPAGAPALTPIGAG